MSEFEAPKDLKDCERRLIILKGRSQQVQLELSRFRSLYIGKRLANDAEREAYRDVKKKELVYINDEIRQLQLWKNEEHDRMDVAKRESLKAMGDIGECIREVKEALKKLSTLAYAIQQENFRLIKENEDYRDRLGLDVFDETNPAPAEDVDEWRDGFTIEDSKCE